MGRVQKATGLFLQQTMTTFDIPLTSTPRVLWSALKYTTKHQVRGYWLRSECLVYAMRLLGLCFHVKAGDYPLRISMLDG